MPRATRASGRPPHRNPAGAVAHPAGLSHLLQHVRRVGGVCDGGRRTGSVVPPDVVGEALSAGGVRPGQLVVEITERTVMEVGQATADTLEALKGLGVRLAIDDFGTGYSSLAHLRSFPVDVLKIDRGFTADLGHEGREGTIAAAILSLGRALGLRTVAEGVERPDQLEALRVLGCPLGQGFHFSRPLPADEATAVLLASPRA